MTPYRRAGDGAEGEASGPGIQSFGGALHVAADASSLAFAPAAPRTTGLIEVPGRTIRALQAGPIAALIAQLLLIATLGGIVGIRPAGGVVGVACGVITYVALASGLSRYRADRLGPADWVTLARATLAAGVAALVASSFGQPGQVTWLLALAAFALMLDAVDGWVARRTRTIAPLGAHFDAEVDAFLILVLSVYVARSAGVWVLAIGAARYAFLAAGWPLAWMRQPLPPRNWRKVVAATQGIVLTIAVARVLPLTVTQALLAAALALLAESFGRDVWWLWSHRHGTQLRMAVADPPGFLEVPPFTGSAGPPPAGPGVLTPIGPGATPTGPGRGRARRSVMAG